MAIRGRHESLLTVHHVGSLPNGIYYTMDAADDLSGKPASLDPEYRPATLAAVLAKGALPPEEALENAERLIDALACLHSEGLAHRDVKPANCIFVDGKLRLADFGLLTPTDSTVSRVGTPQYMPPSGPMDARADVYATGLIIYEMFTGLPATSFPRWSSEALQAKDDPVLEVLPKRFARFGLTLHPTKTRLVQFTRPPYRDPPKGPGPSLRPGTFDLLGFTHYWGRSLRGNWIVKRKTARSLLSRSLNAINQWCRTHRHQKLTDQHRALCLKLRGHYAYDGITGNYAALCSFWYGVQRRWKKWLSRRSQRAYVDWDRFRRLLEHYPLEPPVVVHSIYRHVAKR